MQITLLGSVETFLTSLNEKEIAKTIRTIELLEAFENNLGMPHSKHVANGLLELRIRGTCEIRIFYCFHTNKAILLHAFIKKTQKTPEKELTAARTAKDALH
jgi:phage-related protein